MASGATNLQQKMVTGVAADITVPLDFTPRLVILSAVTGGTIEFGVKTAAMSGSAYQSTSTGTDAGVTIGDRELTIANGADVNVVGATIYIQAWD